MDTDNKVTVLDNSDGVNPSLTNIDGDIDKVIEDVTEELKKARNNILNKNVNSQPTPPTVVTVGGCGSASDGYTTTEVVAGLVVGAAAIYGGLKLFSYCTGRSVLGSQKDLFSFKGSGLK